MAIESVSQFFSEMTDRVQADEDAQEALQEIGATYLFNLTGDGGGTWLMDLTALTFGDSDTDDADCVVTMETADFLEMVNGTTNGQQLFMMGKLMIAGSGDYMSLALRLETVFSAAG